jgi:hypothetical protein
MKTDLSWVDSIYEFRGQWEAPSRCGLKVVRTGDRTVFIVTELYDRNPGTSVTVFCAQLATLLLKEYGVAPERMLFLEHNPNTGSKLAFYEETFDVVSFDWDGEKLTNPDWKRISLEEARRLVDP